ncbi:hypothetical protein BaRGS_00019663 [Batillaria attramentaria]|uniref:Uncharacterized protein n=1 Tax=Batillaria attramentaria TaxID=370345 RepID=A0ABD0KPS6_9CAEN
MGLPATTNRRAATIENKMCTPGAVMCAMVTTSATCKLRRGDNVSSEDTAWRHVEDIKEEGCSILYTESSPENVDI